MFVKYNRLYNLFIHLHTKQRSNVIYVCPVSSQGGSHFIPKHKLCMKANEQLFDQKEIGT